MNFDFTYFKPKETDVIIVPVFEGGDLGETGVKFNKDLGGMLAQRIKNKSFEGKAGQHIELSLDSEVYGAKEAILFGFGKREDLDTKKMRDLAVKMARIVSDCGEDNIHLMGRDLQFDSLGHFAVAEMFDAISANSYKFDKYKSSASNDNKGGATLQVDVDHWKPVSDHFDQLQAVTQSQNWARDLGNEPPNHLTPANYAKRITNELQQFDNVKVKTLDVADMEALGMGGALAVNQGSTKNPGCMVVIEYDGTGGSSEAPLGLVGKGVTFDTGGYNLKPGGSMADMKTDMCGSATVVGAMRSLAARGANAKVVAVVGLVENMVDGHAFRPSDVITMMNGKTVEIGNTDAEGRLVLADALTYIQQEYDPSAVLDFATLTGAMVVALADAYTGVFSNDDDLWNNIDEAGAKADEPGWRMPLGEVFSNAVKGSVADLSNTGKLKGAGASTAAAFLQEFVDEGRPWAHFDIAGTSSNGGAATGVGVRWMNEFVKSNIEGALPRDKNCWVPPQALSR